LQEEITTQLGIGGKVVVFCTSVILKGSSNEICPQGIKV
jgi:hypothetical protein